MKTQKLKKEIEKKLANWNERSLFTIKGVRNLSRSDLDTLVLYADQYERQGNLDGLMPPVGGVKEVLKAYGIIERA